MAMQKKAHGDVANEIKIGFHVKKLLCYSSLVDVIWFGAV
jgi:hypothetical protein